jgi:hypothetical protein
MRWWTLLVALAGMAVVVVGLGFSLPSRFMKAIASSGEKAACAANSSVRRTVS